MAITYHAGRRIQGLEYTAPSTPTFEDDFSSYANQAAADAAYPTTDDSKMRVNITNDNIDVDFERTGSNDLIYYDLGSVNDASWVLRFKWVIDSVSSSNVQGCIGLASNTGSYHTSQDGVFLEAIDTSGANFRMNDPNNALPDVSGQSTMTDTVSTGTRYVEIARTGATSATISFSSTSAYTKDIDSKTYTIENVTGLKYFKIFNNSSGSTSGQVNGTIDDMKFYNGITSVGVGAGDAKPTNVQAGSRFEETDTRKMYNYSYDWFELGTTIPFNATRGVFGGGSATNVMDYITIATAGNATDFGDLSAVNNNNAAVSSDTRGVFCGGEIIGSLTNVMDYITIATTGNTTDFGDLTVARRGVSGVSSDTRGVIAGGHSGGYSNVMDYITIASIGNATDFGDLSFGMFGAGGVSSDTRGVYGGGDQSGTLVNVIQYITIASTGNSTDFGDLTVIREGAPGVSSGTRGVFGGGNTGSVSNVIDYITIATAGNATDFGDLTVARRNPAGVSSATRGVFGGGSTGSHSDIIDYITIATIGNATDFGDLTVARSFAAGVQGT